MNIKSVLNMAKRKETKEVVTGTINLDSKDMVNGIHKDSSIEEAIWVNDYTEQGEKFIKGLNTSLKNREWNQQTGRIERPQSNVIVDEIYKQEIDERPLWTTKTGKQIPFDEVEDLHLARILQYLIRNLKKDRAERDDLRAKKFNAKKSIEYYKAKLEEAEINLFSLEQEDKTISEKITNEQNQVNICNQELVYRGIKFEDCFIGVNNQNETDI